MRAHIDADRVSELASTPAWLRWILRSSTQWPIVRARLLRQLLFVQIQAMHHFYGYHEYHGEIDLAGLWYLTHPVPFEGPPAYVKRLTWRSARVISDVVQRSSYYVGRAFLGMKGSYEEYTPHP